MCFPKCNVHCSFRSRFIWKKSWYFWCLLLWNMIVFLKLFILYVSILLLYVSRRIRFDAVESTVAQNFKWNNLFRFHICAWEDQKRTVTYPPFWDFIAILYETVQQLNKKKPIDCVLNNTKNMIKWNISFWKTHIFKELFKFLIVQSRPSTIFALEWIVLSAFFALFFLQPR